MGRKGKAGEDKKRSWFTVTTDFIKSGFSTQNAEKKENESSNASTPTPSLHNEEHQYPIAEHQNPIAEEQYPTAEHQNPIEREQNPIEEDQYSENAMENSENSESYTMLNNIKEDYLKLHKKYCNKTNGINKKILLEFEEEFSRLIFRIDDIEPINEEIKKSRRQLVKTIQGMIGIVRKRIETANKGKEVDVIDLEEESNLNENHDEEEPMDYEHDEYSSLVELVSPNPQPSTSDNTCQIVAVVPSTSASQSMALALSTSEEPCRNVSIVPSTSGIQSWAIASSSHAAVNTGKKKTLRHNEEGPLQLLHMNTETGLFELDEAAVKSVLFQPQVKNRKIAIVSIVGAFRRGKSFLLNFMLRYLNAQGSPDWLEQSDTLEGFSWRNGKNRDTTGILMWSKAFLVGDDLAVVLLDTQGTFDSQTSMKENTFIFALSTLLSSVQIYNLHERIQMDDLSNLQYFLEFGRMVQKACNSNKVFENLIFLIRDWNFEEENNYGFEGGDQLLQEWLKVGNGSVTQSQAELIGTCFNRVMCFLMPHPGKKVSKNLMFQGCLQDIKAEFLANLKIFIERIFMGDILTGKQIGGEFVNAEQFLMYMTTYVDKLQHPDIEPKTLFQSMCDTSHAQVVSQCKEAYVREMQRAVREVTAVTCDIQAAHQHAVDSALALYHSTPKFGALCDTNLHKKKLVQVLEELYERFTHEFELQVESKLHDACTEAYDTYQATLNAFCMQLQPQCSLEEKSMETCKQAVETIKNLNIRISREKIDSATKTLKKKMETHYKTQEPGYKARQMDMIKQEVLQCYQTLMDTHCGGPDIVPQFDAVHNRAQLKALDVLNTAVNKYNLHEATELFAHVNKEMDKICKRYKKHNQRKVEKEKEDKFNYHMMESHHQAVETYRREMDFECGGMKTVENIQKAHEEAFQSAKAVYSPFVKEYGQKDCQPYINKTSKVIRQLYTKYAASNTEKLQQNVYERAEGLQNSGWQYYEEEMGKLNIGQEPVHNLSDIHEYIKTDALYKLEPVSKSRYYDKCKMNLQQAIDKKYVFYVHQNNKAIQQKRLDEIKHAQEQCVNLYTEKMDALKIDQHPVEDLSEKHMNIKEETLANLHSLLNENENHVLQNAEMEIDKKWQIYKTKNDQITEMFKNEELRTLKCACNEMKADYVTNMNKNMKACLNNNVQDATQLFQFHKKEKEIALANFKEIAKECCKENGEEYFKKLENDIQTAFEEVEESLGTSLRVLRMKEEEIQSGPKKSFAIGIDLGTTNSCAAVYRNGKVEMIYSDRLSDKNKTTTPSVVYFGENEILFGETAVVKGFVDPKNCISELKRIIGRRFDDPVVQSLIKAWPFDVTDSNGTPAISVNYEAQKSYKPEEVSSLVLGEMKRIAEVYLGSQVHDAVVTIPAYFNELQREATKAACVNAGLNVLRMINEPTAAAIAFGLQCKSAASRTLLLFDFGGGTCDISIVAVEGEKFTVKASKGDNQLGGEDFDDRLTEYVAQIIEAKYHVTIDMKEKRRLRHNCERVKRNLTQESKYVLQIEQFTDAKVDVEVHVTREKFEELNEDLFKRAIIPVEQCLEDANLTQDQIDEVVMVGGSSRMPKMRQMLREYFNGKKMNVNINPDEAIAYGAAIQAAICTEEYSGNIHISEITPISLGVDNYPNKMSIIIRKNTQIPCSFTSTRVTVFDQQKVMTLIVYQGESTENEFKNTKLGEFTLKNITRAPAGKTMVYLTYTIDADGILHVTAVEKGKENNLKSLTITKNVL